MNVWNKSCGSCVQKLPKIKQVENYYKNDTNVVIVSLYGALSLNETKDWFFNDYLKKKKLPDLNYSFSPETIFRKLNITSFPHYFIIDKRGEASLFSEMSFDSSLNNNIYEKIKVLEN